MKIAVVCQYFPPESNAPAIRTHEHARQWVRRGHEVSVITGLPSHPNGIVPEEYRGDWLRIEYIDGIEVVRSWIYAAANRGHAKRITSFLSFFMSSVIAGRLHARPDVILATTPQFFSAVSGFLLSRLHGVPFVLEIRDIWPQVAVEMGVVADAAVRPLIRLQRLMYDRADRIVIVSEGFRRHLHEAGVRDEKIVYVPNGISAEILAEPAEPPDALRERLGLRDRFLVSYVGTHGLAHALNVVLEAADRLRGETDIHFLFAGDGAEREVLEAEARERGLENVTFLGQQPRETAAACYRASDVSLVPLRRLPAFEQVLPSKLFEIMGVGVPVVCSVPGEAGRLVERAGGGVVIEPENAEALAAAVLALRNDPAGRAALGEAGRAFVRREHLRETLAERLAGALEEFDPAALPVAVPAVRRPVEAVERDVEVSLVAAKVSPRSVPDQVA
jgi:colanic acid biosynthesis glycosyl transferase WcaI